VLFYLYVPFFLELGTRLHSGEKEADRHAASAVIQQPWVRDLAKPAHSRLTFRNMRMAPAEGGAATKLVFPG
jgi:hypothetical protein